MAKNYKLSPAIQEFILKQKTDNPKLSCRIMALLVKNTFQVNLSKSLINNVIKQGNLSSPVGRRKVKEAVIPPREEALPQVEAPTPPKEVILPPTPVVEVAKPKEEAVFTPKTAIKFEGIKPIKQEADFMENCGFFFLKAADLKLDFTLSLAEALSSYSPNLSKESHQKIIEALIYGPYFKDQKNLWLLIGAEVPQETLREYSEQLIMVPFLQLKESAEKVGINRKFNEINGLWQESLLRLNSYIVHFFPPEYQFLDLPAMRNRFYSLPGRLERKTNLLIIQLFYPNGFFWLNDIIWQEGFSYAANKVNDTGILTPEKEQIWVSPQVKFP